MLRTFSLVVGLLVLSQAVGADAKKPAAVKKDELGNTRNVHSCGSLFLGGQPTAADVELLKEKGIQCVISLRNPSEVDWNEKAAVEQTGIKYVCVPFGAPDTLTDEVFDKVRKQLNGSRQDPALLHCGSANRVGAVWLTHRVLDQNVPLDEAVKEAKAIGMRTPAYQERAIEYIKKKQAEL